MITALYIALVFLLVLANGFFVASEFALVLMSEAGRVLNAGDEITHPSGTFRVEKVDGKRIIRIRFIPSGAETTQEAAIASGLLVLLGSSSALI